MSSTPPRRPSTLSADKFAAAKRPVGWAPDPRAAPRPSESPMTWSARPSASAATAAYGGARAPAGGAPTAVRPRNGDGGGAKTSAAPATRGATASQKDGQILTSLIVAFVILVIGVLTVNVRGNMRVSSSVASVSGTLTAVHARQSTFRLLNQRFATWRELEARGMKLPEAQAVVKSNATASHWFVSVRDNETGVICDKTGELFDEGPNDHQPVCREPGK